MTSGLLRTNSTVSATETTVVKMDMMERAVCQSYMEMSCWPMGLANAPIKESTAAVMEMAMPAFFLNHVFTRTGAARYMKKPAVMPKTTP